MRQPGVVLLNPVNGKNKTVDIDLILLLEIVNVQSPAPPDIFKALAFRQILDHLAGKRLVMNFDGYLGYSKINGQAVGVKSLVAPVFIMPDSSVDRVSAYYSLYASPWECHFKLMS
jgi:hypothetical protein